jgi:hypothetical protein
VEPEIIPPGSQSGRGKAAGGFDSIFISVEEGADGIRRIKLKKPGPFTIIALVLGAGVVVALFFVVLAGLMLLWIPLTIAGILFAMFTRSGRDMWQRVRSLWGGARR